MPFPEDALQLDDVLGCALRYYALHCGPAGRLTVAQLVRDLLHLGGDPVHCRGGTARVDALTVAPGLLEDTDVPGEGSRFPRLASQPS